MQTNAYQNEQQKILDMHFIFQYFSAKLMPIHTELLDKIAVANLLKKFLFPAP
jgi:hypothetical protein